MSFASKHNSGGKLFEHELTGNEQYVDLSQLVAANGIKQVYRLRAIYINTKGKYGAQPVLAISGHLVNAPHHMLDNVKEILADGESVSLINGGYVGFKAYSYDNQHGKQYAVEWVDIQPQQQQPQQPQQQQNDDFDIPF